MGAAWLAVSAFRTPELQPGQSFRFRFQIRFVGELHDPQRVSFRNKIVATSVADRKQVDVVAGVLNVGGP